MMFINNKYLKWYNSIIDKAQKRNWNKVDFYVEKHHIVPRCLGGTDDKNNLVTLTAREHFICHLLLTKITSGQEKYKMISAYSKMFSSGKDNQRYKPNSRFFEMSKKLSSEMMKENNPTRLKSVRDKMSLNSWTKKENAEQIKQKISNNKIGVKLNLTDEQRIQRSKTKLAEKNGMYGKTHRADTLDKLKAKAKGRFTLDWYKGRYGDSDGERLYEERRVWLKNRNLKKDANGRFVKSSK